MSEFEYRGTTFRIERKSNTALLSTSDFVATVSELHALQTLTPRSGFVGGLVRGYKIEKVPMDNIDQDYLDVLSQRGLALPKNELHKAKKKNTNTIENQIASVVRRNRDLLDRRVAIEELVGKADKYGLLHEMSYIGLKHALKKGK